MAVVPVAYPPAASAETPAYTQSAHNIYQPILYTSEQYNPAAAQNGQVPQYINYPVGYTYPYNGRYSHALGTFGWLFFSTIFVWGFFLSIIGATTYPYWGQMAYYVPQAVQTPSTPIATAQNHPATPSITANPSNNHPSSATGETNTTPSWRKTDPNRYT